MLKEISTRLFKSGVRILSAAAIVGTLLLSSASAQTPLGAAGANPLGSPSFQTQAKIDSLIADVQEPEITMQIDPRRSKLVRSKKPVTRFSITDPDVLDIVQYTPTEFELIGRSAGETTMTIWFGDEALRYVVQVGANQAQEELQSVIYGNLERKINEMFPNSAIQLIPFAEKLIVRGQAANSAEASQILAILSQNRVNQRGQIMGPYSNIDLGTAAKPIPGEEDIEASNIISLLDVPGEKQIMLKVRVAELTRTAARSMGANFSVNRGDFALNSALGLTNPVFSAILSTDDVTLAFQASAATGYSKILAEPNLITLNGMPASFISGGEFAVPTTVGVDGVRAATTGFRGFGTQLSFTPTLIDKDRIRLTVSPSFTTINSSVEVQGIPGLSSRAANTTVDLREGQWLAIAGLIQDEQAGSKLKVPGIGDVPILDAVFSRKQTSREETELIILVSPELVHPMEYEEVPLCLPGMEVNDPGDWQFFLFGYVEGGPHCEHRSTVYPLYRQRVIEQTVRAYRDAKATRRFQCSERRYVYGNHGFSR